jgi:hypothetical protein
MSDTQIDLGGEATVDRQRAAVPPPIKYWRPKNAPASWIHPSELQARQAAAGSLVTFQIIEKT